MSTTTMRRFESITGKKGGGDGAMAKEDVVKLVTELQALSSSTKVLKTVLYVALTLLILLLGATAGLVYSVVKLNQDTDVSADGLLVSSSDNSVPIRGGRSRFNLTGVDPLPAKTPEAAAAYLESRYAKALNATVVDSYILESSQVQAIPVIGTSLLYMFTLPNDEQIDALCRTVMHEGQDRVSFNFTGNKEGSPFPTNAMYDSITPSSYILSYVNQAQYGCSEALADPSYKKANMVTFFLSGAPGVTVMLFCQGDFCDLMDMKTQEAAKSTVSALSANFGPKSSNGRRLMEANVAAGRYFDMMAFFD